MPDRACIEYSLSKADNSFICLFLAPVFNCDWYVHQWNERKTYKGKSVWLGELKKYFVWDHLLYLQSGYAELMFPAIKVFLADYDFQVMGGNCSSPPSSFSDLLPSSIIRTLVGRNVSYRELHHHCTLHLQSALLNASNAINIIIIFLLLLASICWTMDIWWEGVLIVYG